LLVPAEIGRSLVWTEIDQVVQRRIGSTGPEMVRLPVQLKMLDRRRSLETELAIKVRILRERTPIAVKAPKSN
jgi:hypothetical protein